MIDRRAARRHPRLAHAPAGLFNSGCAPGGYPGATWPRRRDRPRSLAPQFRRPALSLLGPAGRGFRRRKARVAPMHPPPGGERQREGVWTRGHSRHLDGRRTFQGRRACAPAFLGHLFCGSAPRLGCKINFFGRPGGVWALLCAPGALSMSLTDKPRRRRGEEALSRGLFEV